MINQEEYEILKSLDNMLKWISRDKNRDIFTFEEKPYKRGGEWVTAAIWKDGSDFGHDYVDEVNLFQFIQWEDEKPHSIAELIEEYEDSKEYKDILVIEYFLDKAKRSEEIEVKKDKEWAQKEVDRYLSYEGVNEARNALVFAKGVIDQLDEPEVLSQELPVLPKHVAEYLDFAKSDVSLMRVLELANTRYELPKWEKEFDWISANSEAFAKAWLDGYTVESEQKYYAKIKGHELVNDSEDGYWNVDRNELYIDNIWHDYSGYKTTKLTKNDWNNLGINEDNADFVKVEEVE